jgi:hypothetical protein
MWRGVWPRGHRGDTSAGRGHMGRVRGGKAEPDESSKPPGDSEGFGALSGFGACKGLE